VLLAQAPARPRGPHHAVCQYHSTTLQAPDYEPALRLVIGSCTSPHWDMMCQSVRHGSRDWHGALAGTPIPPVGQHLRKAGCTPSVPAQSAHSGACQRSQMDVMTTNSWLSCLLIADRHLRRPALTQWGPSEAVLLGGLALKRKWQARRKAEGKDISKPNIVMGTETHVVRASDERSCTTRPPPTPAHVVQLEPVVG